MKIVFAAVYEHRHGTDMRVFHEEGDARAWRTQVAKKWWTTEFDEGPPSDELIGDHYFDRMADRNEFFSVTQCELECLADGSERAGPETNASETNGGPKQVDIQPPHGTEPEKSLKIRVVLEFDLENEDGSPITERHPYVWAAEAADDAIRFRLMGNGFLADDTLIGTYSLKTEVVDAAPAGEPEAEKLMTRHGGLWGECFRYPATDWQSEVAHGDTRTGYWSWVAARLEANDDG
jgi:hypothetical protein